MSEAPLIVIWIEANSPSGLMFVVENGRVAGSAGHPFGCAKRGAGAGFHSAMKFRSPASRAALAPGVHSKGTLGNFSSS